MRDAVLVTRAPADATATADAVRALGWRPRLAPLLSITPVPFDPAVFEGAQALLITSRNAVPAAPATFRNRPTFAVGAATGAALRAAGFVDVRTPADGAGAAMAAMAAADLDTAAGPIVHLRGREVAGTVALPGFTLREAIVYAADPALALPEGALDDDLAVVLLYSPRAAQAFATLCAAEADALAAVCALCLSPAVAEPVAGLPWRAIRIAPAPNEHALLGELGPLTGGKG